jgi:hypothetical protein
MARRPPLKSSSAYERLMLAVREQVDTGGDIPCLRPDSKPEWWFSDDERDINRAKERCRVCIVQVLCRRHAIEQNEHGVWAAETKIERNMNALPCETTAVILVLHPVASGQ